MALANLRYINVVKNNNKNNNPTHGQLGDIDVASYGALGNVPHPLDFQHFIFMLHFVAVKARRQSGSLHELSGPCNSFHCLGHFKNVYDDDDDDDDDD